VAGAGALLNPADSGDLVGSVVEATEQDVADAVAAAAAAPQWQALAPARRAAALDRAADRIEERMVEFAGLIVREAGRTCSNALAEVREAVDFLRYYAAQARRELAAHEQREAGAHAQRALGPVVCISPWNFPLAIFTGQVAAALAAGSAVLAKPAEQTPLVAAQAVAVLHAAGVPAAALQLLPGRGDTVGAALIADARIRGVLFTGSTQVARILQRALAGRLDDAGQPITLIAETGGQNAMIVDSSALAEQVVADAITSAFDSAGQRCSALRVLCLQDDIAERVLQMLRGAAEQLRIGPPDRLSTDVGPVIDAAARAGIQAHIDAMRARGRRVQQFEGAAAAQPAHGALPAGRGHFIAPTIIEIEAIAELEREVFGPVLHVLRYRQGELAALIEQINATGYGLTLGIHSRINETIEFITERARVGNQYVNRNLIGAVVGVQPFGGDRLSGTGPKAGGPLYLPRLLTGAGRGAVCATAAAAPASGARPGGGPAAAADKDAGLLDDLRVLRRWLASQGKPAALGAACEALERSSALGRELVLPGPTGERNTYRLVPRGVLLCIAGGGAQDDLLFMLALVLATGNSAGWMENRTTRQLLERLPDPLRSRIRAVSDPSSDRYDGALIMADGPELGEWSRRLARRSGPIIGLIANGKGAWDAALWPLERLYVERSLSVNTAAAGGNASLMTIG
jgi:RHH-type proline utilization regulon transcriptional repressor/proline dehydrogenase/delta 1-pyrroline-5-carboxylate dehydrogenase